MFATALDSDGGGKMASLHFVLSKGVADARKGQEKVLSLHHRIKATIQPELEEKAHPIC